MSQQESSDAKATDVDRYNYNPYTTDRNKMVLLMNEQFWKAHLVTFAHDVAQFQSSPTRFDIVWSISSRKPNDLDKTSLHEFNQESAPKTLFILDSSFNPPTKAHLGLAFSAICQKQTDEISAKWPKPHRLLFLFSVNNATKAPKPASFEHRLVMMQHAAADFAIMWQRAENHRTREDASAVQEDLYIDIGITKEPFYNEKSRVIDESLVYAPKIDQGEAITPYAKHVHLIGWDTCKRVFDPKYYKDTHNPPLSALKTFFDIHEMIVMLRPEGGAHEDKAILNDPKKALREYAKEADGFDNDWLEQKKITMLEPLGFLSQVSSTAVREAVESKDWEIVKRYCTANVAGHIEIMKPYPHTEITEHDAA